MNVNLPSQLCLPQTRCRQIAGRSWIWHAPAKINLTLAILGLRPDGYHGLDSLVAKVTLYDELEFQQRDDGQIRLECEGLDCGQIEKNLVYRAALGLAQERKVSGVDIRLVKRIPPGGGWGGGSSDAATTLQALNQLWELHLSTEALGELAAELGSDVPLFLYGPSLRMQGRGEAVQDVAAPGFYALLYLSPLHCSTKEVYRVFDSLPAEEVARRRVTWDAGAFADGCSKWEVACFNDLEAAAVRVCPELLDLAERLRTGTGRKVHMTGSGSGLFVLADDEPSAVALAAKLPKDMRPHARVTCINPW